MKILVRAMVVLVVLAACESGTASCTEQMDLAKRGCGLEWGAHVSCLKAGGSCAIEGPEADACTERLYKSLSDSLAVDAAWACVYQDTPLSTSADCDWLAQSCWDASL